MTLVVDETDEKAKAKLDELLSYGDREGALGLFGGWTGIDLSKYSDDEDFRFADAPAIRSIVSRWSDTVPGSEGLGWTKARIADFLLVGGMIPTIVGSPTTVVDELVRWADISGVDGFNLTHVVRMLLERISEPFADCEMRWFRSTLGRSKISQSSSCQSYENEGCSERKSSRRVPRRERHT